MRKLMLLTAAAAAFLTSAPVARANVIQNLGNNPNSATGHFSNSVLGTTFDDQYTFNLIGGPQFITFASATNDFTQASDIISGFTGQLFNAGADGLPGGTGAAADTAVGPLVTAVPCPSNPTGCQVLAGSATLGTGSYFLDVKGTGGGTSGYGGDLTTSVVAVPGPLAGAGLSGLLSACLGIWALQRRRRSRV